MGVVKNKDGSITVGIIEKAVKAEPKENSENKPKKIKTSSKKEA